MLQSRSEVIGLGLSDGAFTAPSLGTKETGGQSRSCLPRPVSVGPSMGKARKPCRQLGPRPQLPIKAPDCWLGPTQSGALERQRFCSATDRGLAFERIQLGRAGWLRPGPNQFRASAATSRSGSNTVLFLSMKYTARASLMANTVLALN